MPNDSQARIRLKGRYDPRLYSIAEANKIPLAYLDMINHMERENLPAYTRAFDKEDINYVIFKTLRAYPEDVTDIDMLNMGSRSDYEEMVKNPRRDRLSAYGGGGLLHDLPRL